MLFAFCSLMLVAAGNILALALLRRRREWPWRREVQLFVLAAPLVSLGLALADQVGCQVGTCAFDGLRWLHTPEQALTGAIALVALGGLGLGLARLAVMAHAVTCDSVPAGPQLQAVADRLAARLGVARPRVVVCAEDRPLAFTAGLWRPRVLLSSWMVTHLDRHELEAVLAHELAHAARHDFLTLWVATVLRDAFIYLPTSWTAYRQLHYEKELACDDLAVSVTHRPLGLASALAKVWQQAVAGSSLGAAPTLVGPGEVIEGRITRLLDAPAGAAAPLPEHGHALATSAAAVSGLLCSGGVVVVALMAVMGCVPALFIGKLI